MSARPGSPHQCVAPDVVLGRNVRRNAFVNLYGCTEAGGPARTLRPTR